MQSSIFPGATPIVRWASQFADDRMAPAMSAATLRVAETTGWSDRADGDRFNATNEDVTAEVRE